MKEAELQSMVEQAARLHGLAVFHDGVALRSEPGFPDLVLVGANGVLFRELKTDRGRLSPHQVFWLEALTESGADAAVWRESQWLGEILAEIKALGRLDVRRPAVKPRRRPADPRVRNPYSRGRSGA